MDIGELIEQVLRVGSLDWFLERLTTPQRPQARALRSLAAILNSLKLKSRRHNLEIRVNKRMLSATSASHLQTQLGCDRFCVWGNRGGEMNDNEVSCMPRSLLIRYVHLKWIEAWAQWLRRLNESAEDSRSPSPIAMRQKGSEEQVKRKRFNNRAPPGTAAPSSASLLRRWEKLQIEKKQQKLNAMSCS